MTSPLVQQANERGIFNGESTTSSTTILDDSIFDAVIKEAVPFEPIIIRVHSQEQITITNHGNDLIIVEKIAP